MKFDFDHAAALHRADPEAFELYRQDLISELIETLPLEAQGRWRAYQATLDLLREQLSADDFQAFLFRQMNENLENLSDQFVRLRGLLGQGPTPER